MIKISRIVDNKVDYNVLYEIYVNDILLDKLENGEGKSFRLKIGSSYKIFIRNKNIKSNVITFDMGNDQVIEFECGPMYKETLLSKISKNKKYINQHIKLVIAKDFHL